MNADLVKATWSGRLTEFLPGFVNQAEALRPLAGQASLILHGSTTRGIDDDCSDLDVWLVAGRDVARQAEQMAGTAFFSFVLDGKKGHVNLESREEFVHRIQRCDLERIAELRSCQVLVDPCQWAGPCLAAARWPMAEAVRRSWFCYHYVEMRGEHRACDNPIDRGDPVALLLALTPTLAHAMRAAMVLEGQPYPYVKWLATDAAKTPTGAKVVGIVNQIIADIGRDALHHPGPEPEHPLGKHIREIRTILIDAARASGINDPWLERWWVYMTQARQGIAAVSWGREC